MDVEESLGQSEPERDGFGNDLSLIRSNLAVSPEVRLLRHQGALNLVLELVDAGKNSATGLNQILKVLAENQIDFMVIGGFAGVLYGSAMVTRDLDICMLITPAEVERLRSVLAPYNPVHRMTPQKVPFATEPRSLTGIKNIYLDTDLGALDILSAVKGLPDFSTLRQRATPFDLFGVRVWALSITDLIEAKKQMGRPKDLMAASELEWIKSNKG